MATRSPKYYSEDFRSQERNTLESAAFVLEEKGSSSLLYNSTVIDYLTNSVQSGNTALAWHYWGKLPELRYTTRYISNALSVATLFVGKSNGSGQIEKLPDSHPASELMKDFAGGFTGQAEFLDRIGLHLTVAGDSVAIGPRAGTGGAEPPFDQWRVYSTEEVSARNGKIYLRMPGNAKEVQIPSTALAVRIWRPHPRLWWDADSPVKGSFSVLRELCLFDDHIHASGTSRLTGAGILGIPDELDLPTGEMEIEGTEVDQFVAFLTEVMSLAIKNRESAAAMVPIIIRGPADYISKIQHFDFFTKFDEMVPELREGAIRRIALGMDVPPEILLGSSSSTSWSAWQTDESTLRVHLIPLLQLITSSLTVGWLRPMLAELPGIKEDEINDLVVHYDVSNLKIRQDVSGDAQSLFDRFEIDADSLRKALGYGPDSAPDKKEVAYQILMSLVRGSQPDLVKYALQALKDDFGIDLPDMPDPAAGAPGGPGPGAPGDAMPAPETGDLGSPVPGDRSQAKQTGPAPIPLIGDNSNNG